MNSRENIYSLKGIGKVFRFTLVQTFKNKRFIISFIMFVVIMMAIGPIQYFSGNAGKKAAESSQIYELSSESLSKLYIINETPVELSKDSIASSIKNDYDFGDGSGLILEYKEKSEEDSLLGAISDNEGVIIISQDSSGFHVKGIVSENSKASADDIDAVTATVRDVFDEDRVRASGMSDSDVVTIMKGVVSNGVITEKDYISERDNEVKQGEYFTYLLGFDVIIFMIASLSSSYIIASVTEEKQSKLVESLLVSVRPMALLVGKIFGMMAYVVLMIVCGMAGSRLTELFMQSVLGLDMSDLDEAGINFSLFAENGFKSMLILIVGLILAYIFFGFLSGVFGSAASTTEDIQNATGTIMTVTMIGYFGAFILGAMGKDVINTVISLIPPFSFFTAPVFYITGRIPLYILIISFVIELAAIILIVMLSARTYRTLVLSDSSRPKLMVILKAGRR